MEYEEEAGYGKYRLNHKTFSLGDTNDEPASSDVMYHSRCIISFGGIRKSYYLFVHEDVSCNVTLEVANSSV